MWKQTRSTAWSTIVNRATYWTLPLALAGAQEISQTWSLSKICWVWILVCRKWQILIPAPPIALPRVHHKTPSASSGPKQTSQSPPPKVRIQWSWLWKINSWHLLSCAAGYFSVKPSEEFWLNPGDFLGFSGTGVAGGIAYRSYLQQFQKYIKHFSNQILSCSNCSLEDADYDDGGDKIVEEESSVKFHLEVPPYQAEPIEDF